MRSAVILSALVLAGFTEAAAQGALSLVPGQRLRVTAPSLHLVQYEGTFRGVHGDTLVLESMSAPLSDVTRLDVHRGTGSRVLMGIALFLPLGAGVGYFVGSSAAEDGLTEGAAGICGTVIGGVVGLLLGGALGGATRVDKWEELPLDRLQVSIVPQRDGFGVGARVAF